MNATPAQVKHTTQRIANLAHEVGKAKQDEERWKLFEQLHNAIEELKRRQKRKKTPEHLFPTEEEFEQLRVWLLKNGLEQRWLENIEFAANLPEGCGVVAKKDFQKDEPFLQVPRKLMFTCQMMQETVLGRLIKSDSFLSQSPSLCLALHLLCEKHNHSSFWTPYIRTLPKTYGTCLYFKLEELEGLRGSPTFTSAIKVIATVVLQYTYIHDVFQIRKDIMHINSFTWEEFTWAMSAVGSRQNQVPLRGPNAPPEYALIPAWDMCNHDHGDLQTFYDVSSDSTESHAMRPFKKGEQIYIFYGSRPNSDFLLHSGFVFEKNHFDTLTVRLKLTPDVPHFKDKLQLLQYNKMKMDSQYYLYGNGLAVDLMAFLRIHVMDEHELALALATYEEKATDTASQGSDQGSSQPFDPTLKLNERNELAALELAEIKCKDWLALYPTTIQNDKESLQLSSLSPNMRAVILMRLKEKEILHHTLDAIRLLKSEASSKGAAALCENGIKTSKGKGKGKNKKRKSRKKAAKEETPAQGTEIPQNV